MKAEDRIKQIQWLLFASLLVAAFSRFTIEQLEVDFYEIYNFERFLLKGVFWEGLYLDDVSLNSQSPKNQSDVDDQLNKIAAESSVNSLLNTFPKSVEGIEHLSLWIDVGENIYLDAKLFDVDDAIDIKSISPDKALFSNVRIILAGEYIGKFWLIGKCDIQINNDDKKSKISCFENETVIYLKDSVDQVFDSITPAKETGASDFDKEILSEHYENIKDMVKQGTVMPVINTNVSLFDITVGIILVVIFIQIYSLSSLRRLSTASGDFDGWLFLSWAYSERTNFIDRLSIALEAFVGIVAYLSLTIWPYYSISNAAKIQTIVEADKSIYQYLYYVPSSFLSALILYYLVKIFIGKFREKAGKLTSV